MVPVLVTNADSFVENVIRFPTGQGLVTSPAASPLVGSLLAQHLPNGRIIALALLLAVGFGLAAYLAKNQPRDVRAVAIICTIGLLAAILLMPSTRFGYLLYPVAVAFWAPCLRKPEKAKETPA